MQWEDIFKNVEVTPLSDFVLIENPEVNMFPTKYPNSVVEGTLYELQCDINVAPVQNLMVRWYKDDEIIQTETFNSTTNSTTNSTIKRAQDVSSTLTVNMSRGESGAQFKCEAQLDLGPYGKQPPVISEAHSVFVHCE